MRFAKHFLLLLVSIFALLSLYDTFMPPISMLMLQRAMGFQSVSRIWMPLNKMSPSVARAVITAEDGKFCMHHGVDWGALQNVVEDVGDGDTSHGASTITMQTTKNLFLWNGRSFIRKGLEIPLALGMSVVWSKKLVLQNYLNIAEFGPGVFGAEAAARHYFRKAARNLTPHEAALLAATLPNPKRRNPARPTAYMLEYAASIESRAAKGVNMSCLH